MGNSMGFLKKLKIKPPYDPVIPLLSIYQKNPKNTNVEDTYIPMFSAAFAKCPFICCCCCYRHSVTKPCPTLCDTMD